MLGTVKSNSEISYIFSHGKQYHTKAIKLLVLQSSLQHGSQGRVAFIAGKKNGNAVWRNSAKRRMREVCRVLGGPWCGKDIVFIAKKNIMDVSYSKVLQDCERAFRDITHE